MNETIKAIFSNSCNSSDFIKHNCNREYDKLSKKEYALYNKLEASLSPEILKIFDEFINALTDTNAFVSEQYYIAGFKVGLRLAAEAFTLSDGFNQ